MKQFVTVLTFLLFSIKGFSTYQVEDYLISGKDTLYFNKLPFFFSSPLEQIDSISHNIRKILADQTGIETISTGCWRGFYAEWKIIDNTLYLSKVFDCFTNEVINKAVEKLLGRRFTNGLLQADWVSGTFRCGKDLIYSVYYSVYRHNWKFLIENGIIIKKEYDNPIETVVSEDRETNENEIYVYAIVETPPQFDGKPAETGFDEYVKKNLTDYDGVSGRTFVEFVIEKDGSISNTKVLRKIDPILDAEALRVIKSSPKWTPGKVHGATVRVKYIQRVTFNHYRIYKD